MVRSFHAHARRFEIKRPIILGFWKEFNMGHISSGLVRFMDGLFDSFTASPVLFLFLAIQYLIDFLIEDLVHQEYLLVCRNTVEVLPN